MRLVGWHKTVKQTDHVGYTEFETINRFYIFFIVIAEKIKIHSYPKFRED